MGKETCCPKPYIIEDTVFHKYGSGNDSPNECIADESEVCLNTETDEDLIIE